MGGSEPSFRSHDTKMPPSGHRQSGIGKTNDKPRLLEHAFSKAGSYFSGQLELTMNKKNDNSSANFLQNYEMERSCCLPICRIRL